MDLSLTALPRAWPFQEAAKLVERYKHAPPAKGYVLFETGYGPSGLPHIGTFGEVVRTSMVRHAFTRLSDIPTKLFCISDDLDGLRKVPDNLPNQAMLRENLGRPLTSIPDPFGTHESYGAHMNARLRAFLDAFGFEYAFHSSTENYKSGLYDTTLLTLLERYDAVMNLMLPTLGEERQKTYSPFLPIDPESGQVLYVPILERNVEKGAIVYEKEGGTRHEIPVTGGHCKLQWKPDMGMRWAALGVDYEMYGKDHLASGRLYSAICSILGGNPPEQMVYELFLDEKGQKISKSKGNGITIEEWLRYAPQESLSLYMYQSPPKAKRLYFDVIPRQVDDYLAFREKYPTESGAPRFENPVWHIHHGHPPKPEIPISFSLLLNLAGTAHSEDPSVLWGFISQYKPEANPANCPFLDQLVGYAVKYYQDFIKPNKTFRTPTDKERIALEALRDALEAIDPKTAPDVLQNETIYRIGTEHGFEPMKTWFSCLYEVLLGETQGPRMGSFIALYGTQRTAALIARALAGESLAA